jgi:mannose-6-phosphate isomerase
MPRATPFTPEDWIGSTVARFGSDGAGLTRLGDGRLLRDAIAERSLAYLGREHLDRFGPDPQLLVKLLNPEQRIPVHAHPDRGFACRHLGMANGKTEGWVVLATSSPQARVYLGFSEAVEADALRAWVRAQETGAMLQALNGIQVRAGDAILVPAGAPHAIGPGILLLELQEPTDLSVLMEWRDLDLDGEREGHLGLGFEVALDCVDRSAFTGERLASLQRQMGEGREQVTSLFVRQADEFFRAELVRPSGEGVTLTPQYSILVAIDGRGELRPPTGDPIRLGRGDTVLVPYAAGECVLEGSIDCIRCLPPSPLA